MNEYIYKSFSDKFESQKLRHDFTGVHDVLLRWCRFGEKSIVWV